MAKDDKEKKENTNHPFGRWETVAVYDSSITKPEETIEEKEQTCELSATKFKEKQLPASMQVKDLSENVVFKKRKNNQEKKRSIRQRTNDS